MPVKKKRLIPYSQNYPCRIYGIDFSGAKNAGKRIWITSGITKNGILRIQNCQRAEALPGSGTERDRCLAALRDFITKDRMSAFGIDFPFGLPRGLVTGDSWEDFILSFPYRYSSAEDFRKSAYSSSGGSELKRVTDIKSQTPFSPYNLRLYRQTFFGIRELLAPLVKNQSVCVLPMQKALMGKPWLLEVCPASTLKQERLYFPYKGRTEAHRMARARILKWIEESCVYKTARLAALDDYYGDALDSIVAAFVTFNIIHKRTLIPTRDNDAYQLEGYVYV